MQTPVYFYNEFYDKWDKVMPYYERLFSAIMLLIPFLLKNFSINAVPTAAQAAPVIAPVTAIFLSMPDFFFIALPPK